MVVVVTAGRVVTVVGAAVVGGRVTVVAGAVVAGLVGGRSTVVTGAWGGARPAADEGARLAGPAHATTANAPRHSQAAIRTGVGGAIGFLDIEAVFEHQPATGARFRRSRYRAAAGVLLAAAAVVSGCGSTPKPKSQPQPPAAPTTTTAVATTTTTVPASTTTATPTTTTTPITTTTPTTTGVAAFEATVDPVTAASVPHTWRPGCPVGTAQLRMIHLTYWGFDGRPHPGSIVVSAAVVNPVITAFRTLYQERFPIREMVPEDAYNGSDNAAAAADDTSGFNCRYAVAPGPPSWSVHAFGEAIDVNDIENPYVEGSTVIPPAGVAYENRSIVRPGMAVPGGELVEAFASVGWQWGGRWTGSPDYQHFSATGG